MKKTKKRLLIVAIVLVVFFLLNMGAANIVFHIIFDRYDYDPSVDPAYTAEDEVNYPRTEIHFESDGNELVGDIYYASEPVGNLILAHGMHSYADRYLPITEYFVDQGWNVIAYDMTGTGDSEGSYTVGLSQMTIDLLSAIDFVKAEPTLADYPIVLWGHSLGGYAAVAALTEATDIAGVVSVSAFDNPTDIMKDSSKQYVGVMADATYPFMWLQNKLLFGKYANISAMQVLQETDVPVLVIYGNKDEIVTKENALYSRWEVMRNPNISFVLIGDSQNCGHTDMWFLGKDHSEYVGELNPEFMEMMNEYLMETIQ